MRAHLAIALAALGACTAGCEKSLKSTRAFALPAGDIAQGQAAFVALKCTQCHTVNGVDLPAPTEPAKQTLALGGAVVQLRTYGDLLTAIIHPGYTRAETVPMAQWRAMSPPPMRPVNDVMTVQQMIDLVAFLQPRYTQLEPLFQAPLGP